MQTVDVRSPAGPAHRHLAAPEARAAVRRIRVYDLATRFLGSAWFLLLAVLTARRTMELAGAPGAPAAARDGWPGLLAGTCLVIFYLAIWWFIATRPPAVARSRGVMPTIAAFIGTYLPWSISLFGKPQHIPVLNVLSAVFLVFGTGLMVLTLLHLGRSFSLVPQARRVVQAGPYRWIKHPLYLSEEIAVLGTVLQYFSPGAIALLAAHVAVQVRRVLYEEELLRQALPEYRAYESSRWRFVPYVW